MRRQPGVQLDIPAGDLAIEARVEKRILRLGSAVAPSDGGGSLTDGVGLAHSKSISATNDTRSTQFDNE